MPEQPFQDHSINLDIPSPREFAPIPDTALKPVAACPVCGDAEYVEFYVHIDTRRPTTTWQLCEKCGHFFVSPAPSQRWLNKYYKEQYRIDTHGTNDPEKISAVSVQDEAQRGMRLAQTYLRFTNRIDRLLDIGSSSGVAIASVFDRYKIKKGVGVEPNDCYRAFAEKMSQMAPELPGKVSFVSSLGQVKKSPKFDLVSVIHVLEHLANPVKMLVSCKQYLSARGLLVVEVPFAFGGITHPFLWPHLHAFTPNSLTAAIEKAGLFVQHIDTVPMAVGPWWPSPKNLTAFVHLRPRPTTLDNALDSFNMAEFHRKYTLHAVEDAKAKSKYQVG